MQRLSELIRKMGNNAKWLTITEPGWSIPMPWVFYYQPIYMKAFGVTGFELGLLLTFSQALSIFSPLLGELFIARLGMKWTFLLIDTLTNAGYLLPLILAKSQADFVAVYVFSALFAAVGPVWETLLAEGTAPEARAIGYSIASMLQLVSGLMTPLAGLLLTQCGIIEGYRMLATIALVAFLAKTAVLVFKLEEPKNRKKSEKDSVTITFAFKAMMRSRNLLLLSAFNVISSITVFTVPTYLPLYLEDSKGLALNPEEMGVIQAVSSAVSLVALFHILTRPYTPASYRQLLTVSVTAGIAGYITYLIATPQVKAIAFVAAAFLGIKYIEFTVARTFLVNAIDEVDPAMKSKVFSILYTANQAITIPAPALLGLAYTYNPRNLWILAAALSAVELAIALKLYTRREKRQRQN